MPPYDLLPPAPEDIRLLIEAHRAFYEVLPRQIVLEERSAGAAPTTRRIQAGFDIDVYGAKTSNWPGHSPEYELGYRMLKHLVDTIRANPAASCFIEAIPFPSTTILDTKNHLQPLAIMRITIARKGDLHQPAGTVELQALRAIEDGLRDLGLRRT